jgi:hypothetical protein
MKNKSRAPRRHPAHDVAQIAAWAPFVMGQRLMRFADTSPARRRRNEVEAFRMASEKSFALAEACWGLGWAALKTNLDVFGALASGSARMTSAVAKPVRRRVVANAGRLGKRR